MVLDDAAEVIEVSEYEKLKPLDIYDDQAISKVKMDL